MSNDDFKWIFPPAAPGPSGLPSFSAQNATGTTGFGTFPVYVSDSIKLEWADPIDSTDPQGVQFECGINRDGSRSSFGPGQAFKDRPPIIFTLEFLSVPDNTSFSSTPPSPLPSPATETCVIFFFNSSLFTYYFAVAFPIINATRSQPLLYSLSDPSGIPYNASDILGSHSSAHGNHLGIILGSVLGCFGLLVVVVLGVCWFGRRARRVVKKDDAMGVELDSTRNEPPPSYRETTD